MNEKSIILRCPNAECKNHVPESIVSINAKLCDQCGDVLHALCTRCGRLHGRKIIEKNFCKREIDKITIKFEKFTSISLLSLFLIVCKRFGIFLILFGIVSVAAEFHVCGQSLSNLLLFITIMAAVSALAFVRYIMKSVWGERARLVKRFKKEYPEQYEVIVCYKKEFPEYLFGSFLPRILEDIEKLTPYESPYA